MPENSSCTGQISGGTRAAFFTEESQTPTILLLLSGTLLTIVACSPSQGGYVSERIGSDKRWQEYARTRERASKEIDLPLSCPCPPDMLSFVVSLDRQKGLYRCPSAKRGVWAVHTVDLNTGNSLPTLEEGHPDYFAALAFSRDGRKALLGGKNGTIHLRDLSSGKDTGQSKSDGKYMRCIACSPAAEKALSGHDGGTILVWDIEKMSIVTRLVGHKSGIRHNCLVWSPDGKSALSGSWDGSVRLWDVETGRELAHLQPSYGRVMSLALSPDGKYALSSYLDGPKQPVILWDLDAQKEINRFGVPGNPWFADQQLHVASVAFSPDGKTALFGLVFGTVIWWDVNEWRAIAMNRLHARELVFVAFSLDGKSSISVGNDSETDTSAKVKFWQLPARSDTPLGAGESLPASEQPTSPSNP